MSQSKTLREDAPVGAGGPQIWHHWPHGWPPRPGDRTLCGIVREEGAKKREPHEMCVVCEDLCGR